MALLNSCNSAAQLYHLVGEVVPFAIGMAESIGDIDAISYAAQFYAATANGQSIRSSHDSARAALELVGLDSYDLPTLACATGADPASTVLVLPGASETVWGWRFDQSLGPLSANENRSEDELTRSPGVRLADEPIE